MSLVVVEKKHQLFILDMKGYGPPRIENEKLVFLFHNDEAHSVSVAGDFQSQGTWRQTSFMKQADGIWRAEIEAPAPGRYEYKFVVNGMHWMEDPANGMKTSDSFGGLNSVLYLS